MKITVIVKQPFSKPYVTEIENSLKSFQNIVGGYIECIEIPDAEGIDIILNEEGKIYGLAPNVYLPEYDDCIMGPIIVVAFDSSSGEHIGLNDKQISEVMHYLNDNHVKDFEQFARRFCL